MDMMEDYRPRMTHAHDEHRYSYCPLCAGRLEARSLKATEPERLVCVDCGFVFYLDPKVAVGTIIRDEDSRIVLVRRAIEPGYGKWVIPGGYVDRGEQVHVAAIREAREEAGLDVQLEKLINIYSYAGRAPVIIVYAASILGGTLECDDEGLEARFFHAHEIPWDELAFRSTEDALREFLEQFRPIEGAP
jgi:ADP-ribose pyrophosphatase YjhB (NUDIX family)